METVISGKGRAVERTIVWLRLQNNVNHQGAHESSYSISLRFPFSRDGMKMTMVMMEMNLEMDDDDDDDYGYDDGELCNGNAVSSSDCASTFFLWLRKTKRFVFPSNACMVVGIILRRADVEFVSNAPRKRVTQVFCRKRTYGLS